MDGCTDERTFRKMGSCKCKWGLALVVGIGSLLTVTLGTAAMEEYPGSIAALRLYLIWDDNRSTCRPGNRGSGY